MERKRSFYDADASERVNVPTNYRTAQNCNEIPCSMCGQDMFVDDSIFAEVNASVEKAGENTFLCENCVWESEEEAFQH